MRLVWRVGIFQAHHELPASATKSWQPLSNPSLKDIDTVSSNYLMMINCSQEGTDWFFFLFFLSACLPLFRLLQFIRCFRPKKWSRGAESVLNNSGILERQFQGTHIKGTGTAPQKEAGRGRGLRWSRATIVKMKVGGGGGYNEGNVWGRGIRR